MKRRKQRVVYFYCFSCGKYYRIPVGEVFGPESFPALRCDCLRTAELVPSGVAMSIKERAL